MIPLSCPRKQAAVLLAAVLLVARQCACDPCGAENSSSFEGVKMCEVWHPQKLPFETCFEKSGRCMSDNV